MVGWIAFILGLFIVCFAAAKGLGQIYCLMVAVAWYILLMRSINRAKKKRTAPTEAPNQAAG